jgi:small subunit ribosomal protein S6e
MVEFKLVLADGPRSYASSVNDAPAAGFLGKRIGEVVGGELFGVEGYTFRISGGTDRAGFPLRGDLPGGRQLRLFVGDGFGFHAPRHGQHRRRTYRGGTISEETVQINLTVEQRGKKPLAELLQPAS